MCLILDNEKLVHHCIKKWRNPPHWMGVEYEDFVQIGNYALCKAAKTFDTSKGTWANHACTYIRSDVRHYIRDKSSLVRRPRWLKDPVIVMLGDLKDQLYN